VTVNEPTVVVMSTVTAGSAGIGTPDVLVVMSGESTGG
jgi:hypothetical protein